jgi:hypothetical protein
MTVSHTWQEAVLAHFTPKRERLLLAVDPDNLLGDETILAEIQNRNYDVLPLNNDVDFRLPFERDYRSRWDDGQALSPRLSWRPGGKRGCCASPRSTWLQRGPGGR